MPFGNDSVLMYDVAPWNQMGFGVPQFGPDNVTTLNRPIHGLCDEIGKIQLSVMTHGDAARHQPPSRNTLERLGKLCNRAASVLGSRQKAYNESRLEVNHASPAPMVWNIHPVPYFDSYFLKNKWLSEYNDLLMILLTNAYQHTDNAVPLTVTVDMAKDLYQYVREIKIRMGTELIGLDLALVSDDAFRFDATHYDLYNPDSWYTRIEAVDRATSFMHLPTEDDLHPLLQGIPANLILPNLKYYPVGPIPGADGIPGTPIPFKEAATGTKDGQGGKGSAIGPATV